MNELPAKDLDGPSTSRGSSESQLRNSTAKVNFLNSDFLDHSEVSSHFAVISDENSQNEQHNESEQEQQPLTPTVIRPSRVLASPMPTTNDPAINLHGSISLKDMGFRPLALPNWNNKIQLQAGKRNLNDLLRNMLETVVKPNIQIKIGTYRFNCHIMVLQCYSEYFMAFTTELVVELPEQQVTPAAFMMAYEWMLADMPLVQRDGIVELLSAARFLGIKDLSDQCWACLDDDRICEDAAFFVLMEARKFEGLECLEQLMVMRICKFFLSLVASADFLTLNCEDVITIFSSNFIGVTSEVEVFMSGVRWLNHNWEERQQFVVDIIKTVRFALMPLHYLMRYTKPTDCIQVDRIITQSDVNKMIVNGMKYMTMNDFYGYNRIGFSSFLKDHSLVAPIPRVWLSGKKCILPFGDQFVSYETFLQNLQSIQDMEPEYWRTLEVWNDTEFSAAKRCRHSVDVDAQ